MSANLHSVIATMQMTTLDAIPANVAPIWEAALRNRESAEWMLGQATTHDQRVWAASVKDREQLSMDNAAWGVFLKENLVPVPMQAHAPEALKWAFKTPRAGLGSILDVVDRLGFVVLPLEYVNPKAWENEDQEMKEAIQKFGSLAGGKREVKNRYGRVESTVDEPRRQDVYVVCPPSYYSIDRHISAEDPNLQIYAGKNEQAFLAMTMMVPTLRMMRADIGTLDKNQQAMNNRQNNLADAVRLTADQTKRTAELVRNTEVQLERLQTQVDGAIRAETRRVVQAAASTPDNPESKRILDALAASQGSLTDLREATAALEEVKFRILDPMMFALNPQTDLLRRDGNAMIGPCWGPDFSEIITEALGLKSDRRTARKTGMALAAAGLGPTVSVTAMDILEEISPAAHASPMAKKWLEQVENVLSREILSYLDKQDKNEILALGAAIYHENQKAVNLIGILSGFGSSADQATSNVKSPFTERMVEIAQKALNNQVRFRQNHEARMANWIREQNSVGNGRLDPYGNPVRR